MRTILTLAFALTVWPWADKNAASVNAQEKRGAVESYQELLKAYTKASGAFRGAESDEQRRQCAEQLGVFPQRFIELAERHRNDPVALVALQQAIQAVLSADSQTQYCWELNREQFPDVAPGDSSSQIVEILLRDHLRSDQLAPICDRMRYGFRREFEKLLLALIDRSPHRNTRALACLATAQLLRNQLQIVDRVAARPEWIARYNTLLSEDYLAEIRGDGRAALDRRIESLYEQALQYDDVMNFSFPETIAEKAKAELHEIRNLSLGKSAPEITGHDQNSRPLKLSDFRGKIVLLYFWSEY
jgi:hypothetical protein